MPERAVPPQDIDPEAFFTEWVPAMVAADETRRRRLADTEAVLEFTLVGEGADHGIYCVHLRAGAVSGSVGAHGAADLQIQLDVETWQRLNKGELSAPDAFLRRKVKLQGNLALAVKLHLILG